MAKTGIDQSIVSYEIAAGLAKRPDPEPEVDKDCLAFR